MNARQLAQLEQEEKELEGKLFGAPESEATTTEEATKVEEEKKEVPAEEKEPVTPSPEPTPEATKKPTGEPEEDWEKRYKNLRNSRDKKLYEVKTQLAGALNTIQTLQQQIEDLKAKQPKVDPFAGVFTEEDKETLGDTTVSALQKATQKATEAATKPLQDQLEAERKLRVQQEQVLAAKAKQDAYDVFITRVARAVPDWQDVDLDPNFKTFMSAPDVDGSPRREHFLAAENRGDAATIIRYMMEFKQAVSKPKADPLADKITPTGGAGSTTTLEDKKPEVITSSFVDEFYDALNRGAYQGRQSEADAIMARIDKATVEGRIIMR